MKEGVKRGLAVAVTFLVLLILLTAGPAQAVILGLSVDEANVKKGELINFQAEAEVEAGEMLDVEYFVLKLEGPETIECKFDTDGNPISGCDGIHVARTEVPPVYGYGYGFGEGFFKFNITLDTLYFESGKYETYLEMWVEGEPYIERGEEVMITPQRPPVPLAGCSIRAEGGELIAEGENYGKGKINFHIPLGNANNGKGSLTAQKGRERVSYKFDVVDVISNNDFIAEIAIEGECKINGDVMDKTAIITYDKIAETISINCDPELLIENMHITFRKFC
jgi:hypothetical protein